MVDEVEATGVWLAHELLALGCDEKLAKDICFALGQRQAMLIDEDLWVPARAALERYKRGEWDTPGYALAAQLCKEAWGDPADQERVKVWLQRAVQFRAMRARKGN